jgi:hypothetical protein
MFEPERKPNAIKYFVIAGPGMDIHLISELEGVLADFFRERQERISAQYLGEFARGMDDRGFAVLWTTGAPMEVYALAFIGVYYAPVGPRGERHAHVAYLSHMEKNGPDLGNFLGHVKTIAAGRGYTRLTVPLRGIPDHRVLQSLGFELVATAVPGVPESFPLYAVALGQR